MSDKDWVGSQKSLFVTMGASNHAKEAREVNDYYATDPWAIDCLKEKIELPHVILEPSCGEGHLSKRLEALGHKVYSYDKINRGYGDVQDYFFMENLPEGCECIITNPPFKYLTNFVLHSLELLPEGGLCCMFVKTTTLEGVERWEKIYRNCPPYKVLQFVRRILCAKNGDFETYDHGAGIYAWFVWRKGFKGAPTIDWINTGLRHYSEVNKQNMIDL